MRNTKSFNYIEKAGDVLVELFHTVGLFVVGGTVVWSAVHAYIGIMHQSHAGLDDILLLFIYLELGAMIGIYFKTHRLPVRFLIYIAITALTRLLAIDIKTLPNESIITLTIAIFILTLAELVLRFGNMKFSRENEDGDC
ncbi:phosphate-starvation-inducible protein PsiE [Candidatus Marithrix sp. Canyon 246]|uniref:phosphate-starvation-inducible protein PsiE n=1 Tax=Candidatus Marithrix sp. Canyon 246 TaxID=1827136 RepID=UPI00084A2C7F|nr:phosphate-starvation-inducible PsiE family protein [Candidatus Marithrix sp. Canyon 246]